MVMPWTMVISDGWTAMTMPSSSIASIAKTLARRGTRSVMVTNPPSASMAASGLTQPPSLRVRRMRRGTPPACCFA